MDETETRIALYKLYLETAEKVSDRRASANTWMLSVNSAVVALYGYLGKDEGLGAEPDRDVWLWAIPAAGILVCLAWIALLDTYRKLNAAKFKVLQDVERSFEHQPFAAERQYYKAEGRRPLSRVESWIPWSFAFLLPLYSRRTPLHLRLRPAKASLGGAIPIALAAPRMAASLTPTRPRLRRWEPKDGHISPSQANLHLDGHPANAARRTEIPLPPRTLTFPLTEPFRGVGQVIGLRCHGGLGHQAFAASMLRIVPHGETVSFRISCLRAR